ncbi:hypothetical protein [Tabrizicola sp.]|uniref:hypothetical protein n=1 Tax=Tabrizicola sp. TaxID=2005166 RepID=UPI0035B4237D
MPTSGNRRGGCSCSGSWPGAGATDWDAPALRLAENPPLLTLGALDKGVWGRAKLEFDRHVADV